MRNKLLGICKMTGVTTKFIVAMSVVITLLSVLGISFITAVQERAMAAAIEAAENSVDAISAQQINENKKAIEHKAGQQARLLAAIAPQPIAEFDLSLLARYASMTVEDPDIAFVGFYNGQDKPFAERGDRKAAIREISRKISQDGLDLGKVVLGYHFGRADRQAGIIQDQTRERFARIEASAGAAQDDAVVSIVLLFILVGAATIGLSILLITVVVKRPLQKVVAATDHLADGDLTHRVAHQSNDELGRLATAFNAMADRFANIIHEVGAMTRELTDSSTRMKTITEKASQGVHQQHVETDQVAAAMNEMSMTVQEVARSAVKAADCAGQANGEAHKGKEIVNTTINAIKALASEVEQSANATQKLEAESKEISSVVDVINSIAEQTNLLALNAAIEAARAGEQGRGFAVVADEVRTLAQRTQESTREIEDMIGRLQTGANQAVHAMETGRELAEKGNEQAKEARQALEAITRAVTTINNMTIQIASAAEEQSATTEEMNRNINTISEVADQTASGAEQTTAAATELARLATQLQGLVEQFRIQAGASH
jgi:methyl-accepting chemotaxis protein